MLVLLLTFCEYFSQLLAWGIKTFNIIKLILFHDLIKLLVDLFCLLCIRKKISQDNLKLFSFIHYSMPLIFKKLNPVN